VQWGSQHSSPCASVKFFNTRFVAT
jgi:hypothetical protein